jgi:hypothetical protein
MVLDPREVNFAFVPAAWTMLWRRQKTLSGTATLSLAQKSSFFLMERSRPSLGKAPRRRPQVSDTKDTV